MELKKDLLIMVGDLFVVYDLTKYAGDRNPLAPDDCHHSHGASPRFTSEGD